MSDHIKKKKKREKIIKWEEGDEKSDLNVNNENLVNLYSL